MRGVGYDTGALSAETLISLEISLSLGSTYYWADGEKGNTIEQVIEAQHSLFEQLIRPLHAAAFIETALYAALVSL